MQLQGLIGRLLVSVLGLRLASAGRVSRRIDPALEPKSDKKFFGPPFPADYPDDKHAKASDLHKDFDHPYPIVQDSDTYESDFVKDENKDGGEWQAQYNYDKLRAKLRSQRRDLEEALAKVKAEEEQLAKVQSREDAAESAYKKADGESSKSAQDAANAGKAAQSAEEKAKAAEAEARRAESEQAGDLPMKDQVASDQKAVEEATAHLADCTKQLEDAKRKLRETLDKQEEAVKAKQSSLNDKKGRAASEQQKAHDDVNEAEARKAALENASKNSETKRDAEKQHLDQERSRLDAAKYEHELALKKKETAEKAVQKTEDELKRAAADVQALRGRVDKDGGVYPVEKPEKQWLERGGAATPGTLLSSLPLMVMVFHLAIHG